MQAGCYGFLGLGFNNVSNPNVKKLYKKGADIFL